MSHSWTVDCETCDFHKEATRRQDIYKIAYDHWDKTHHKMTIAVDYP